MGKNTLFSFWLLLSLVFISTKGSVETENILVEENEQQQELEEVVEVGGKEEKEPVVGEENYQTGEENINSIANEVEGEQQISGFVPVVGPDNIVKRIFELSSSGDVGEEFLSYLADDVTFSVELPSTHPLAIRGGVGKQALLEYKQLIAELVSPLSSKLISLSIIEREDNLSHILATYDNEWVFKKTGKSHVGEVYHEYTFNPENTQIVSIRSFYPSNQDFRYLYSTGVNVLRSFIEAKAAGNDEKAYSYVSDDLSFKRSFPSHLNIPQEDSKTLVEHRAFEESLAGKVSVKDVRINDIFGDEQIAIAQISFKSTTVGADGIVNNKHKKVSGKLVVTLNEEGKINSIRYSPDDWDSHLNIKEQKKQKNKKKN